DDVFLSALDPVSVHAPSRPAIHDSPRTAPAQHRGSLPSATSATPLASQRRPRSPVTAAYDADETRRGGLMLLGVLDQSPVREGSTAAQAMRETIALARRAEAFGYERFWIAEHLGSVALASSAPEILI